MMLDHYQQTKNLLVSLLRQGAGLLLIRRSEGIFMAQTLDDSTGTVGTDKMRAAVVTNSVRHCRFPSSICPLLAPGEALVKLETSGVCHTDLHAAQGDWPVKPTPPFVPGHGGYGIVVALGPGVDDLAIGDKVGNAWLWSACGS